VQVYDGGAVDAVEKAIQAADLGLNPMRDGNLLRIAIPPLTEERRKDLVKKLNKLGEEEKVALRNHRRDANDAVKKQEKDKKITQDDSRKSQEEIQKVTDKFIAEIEQIMKQKEKEIMDV
jgi:ribosome recycling factor